VAQISNKPVLKKTGAGRGESQTTSFFGRKEERRNTNQKGAGQKTAGQKKSKMESHCRITAKKG